MSAFFLLVGENLWIEQRSAGPISVNVWRRAVRSISEEPRYSSFALMLVAKRFRRKLKVFIPKFERLMLIVYTSSTLARQLHTRELKPRWAVSYLVLKRVEFEL